MTRAGVRRLLGLVPALAVCAGFAASAPPARAGEWVQVSCVNPDGSAAPSEGWTGESYEPTNGSSVSARCGPMTAEESALAPAPVGAYEALEYTPPSGSTLVGGTLNLTLRADGDGPSASSEATVYEPARVWPSDVILNCANGQSPCQNGTDDYSGAFTLPPDLGGDLYVVAECGGSSGGTCENGTDGFYSVAQVNAADLLLHNAAVPTAAGFTGTLLDKRARGVGQLIFTASDAGGPGIYSVTVAIDGTPVYAGTPNTNDGMCVAVGTDASTGALMFDHQQPCLVTESVDIPVNTATLPDGSHELTVSETDAAGNTATVLDQDITTSNPQLTPKPKRGLRARFALSWRWDGAHTLLRSISAQRLPRHGSIAISCKGPHCPRLRPHRVGVSHARRFLRGLHDTRFHATDLVFLTVRAPHREPERILLQIRAGRQPRAILISGHRTHHHRTKHHKHHH